MLCRHSDRGTPRAARKLELGPDTALTPGSPTGALPEEEEQANQHLPETDHPRQRKKTGDEPPRRASPAAEGSSGAALAEDESQEDAETEMLASHDSGEFNSAMFAISVTNSSLLGTSSVHTECSTLVNNKEPLCLGKRISGKEQLSLYTCGFYVAVQLSKNMLCSRVWIFMSPQVRRSRLQSTTCFS